VKIFNTFKLIALSFVAFSSAYLLAYDVIVDDSVYSEATTKIVCMSYGVDKNGNDVVGKAEDNNGRGSISSVGKRAEINCGNKGGINCGTAMCVGI